MMETQGGRVFNIAGNYIEHQEITVESGGVLNFGEARKDDVEATERGSEELISELKVVFYGDEDVTSLFLEDIKGRKPMDIVRTVRNYVCDKRLSERSCHRDLWQILNKNGIYTLSESNWNKALRAM